MSRLMKVKKVAPASLDEALAQFLNWKKANGISEQTILDYTTHVNLLFKRFPFAKDSYEQLEQSVYEHLGQEKIKPATYNNRLVYLRSFFEWCVEQEVLSENPLSKFKKRKDEGKVVNIDENVLTDLIQLPNKNTYAGLRDYALFLVFLDCGIRPKEAFSLMDSDFNSKSFELFVDKEKAWSRASYCVFQVYIEEFRSCLKQFDTTMILYAI